ncbi:U3 snoRNP protein [Purpureocillium takamizusanense]|uniref:U3 snoRNP protein n=1 Tax=Purpureocillium takamizusanense TaxID=2060973 RepID=A0A9Q8QD78_9HYPO|nr:U3 snoRNP protein [Purpureocillium takamizusanense]UNI17490.1 U3 snoRNP protein [Purpureocillium takamizusanense]
MAGVAEKARFYLERSVPQLREWEDKGVFSKDEIRNIVQKRNDYEHRVLSPGNKPAEWSSYAKWEQSLEALKSKRCKRLKIRHLNSAHAGQGRVLAIYERSVNRHPASGELWREYLAYTAGVKATKRWRKTMTNALRMNPTDPELWVMAGRRAARNGDMASSRGFFMRGCRFCNKECGLWMEYARSEMEWLAKVDKRKAKPGKAAKDPLRPDRTDADDELRIEDSDAEDDDDDGDNELPVPSRAQAKAINEQESAQLRSNPAMDGAIPIAIFDISRKQPFFKADVAEAFYVMLGAFRSVSVQPKVAQHVLHVIEEQFPEDPATCSCYIRQPILGLSPHTADFAANLRTVLGRLTEKLESTTDRARLAQKTIAWMDEYLALDGLDDSIRAVLKLSRERVAGDVL